MKLDKDSIIRIVYTIIVSIIICLLSTVVFKSNEVTFSLVAKSVAVGLGIWLLAEITFSFIEKVWPHNIFPSYVALILLIVIGTSIGSYLIGVRSLVIISIVSLCAEIFGLSITILYRRYYKKELNKHLEEFKKKV